MPGRSREEIIALGSGDLDDLTDEEMFVWLDHHDPIDSTPSIRWEVLPDPDDLPSFETALDIVMRDDAEIIEDLRNT